jgi:hypothetical protein
MKYQSRGFAHQTFKAIVFSIATLKHEAEIRQIMRVPGLYKSGRINGFDKVEIVQL